MTSPTTPITAAPMSTAFPEQDLVTNRVSVLIYGGTDRDRRAWAEQAMDSFPEEGELIEVASAAQLQQALGQSHGVVFIPDVGALGSEAQAALMRCLQQREERPKFVVGVTGSVERARENGTLREDLLYRLTRARVDLSDAQTREALKRRSDSARPAEKRASAKSAPRAASRPVKADKASPGKAHKR